ncbi:MAG: hypothetical protein ACE5JG_12525 [Planctomycetota bacterium]
MFTVELSACQNPDFPRRSDLPGKRTVQIAGFREASVACRRFIEEHDLGGGNWSGGRVRETATGRVIALVSYNGRVWTPERNWRDRKEVSLEEAGR